VKDVNVVFFFLCVEKGKKKIDPGKRKNLCAGGTTSTYNGSILLSTHQYMYRLG
jgi:hypothetical protein